jgi:uncharacterized RDD family membrane protein YckC
MRDQIYGGFWRRLLAYVIDQIILYLISLILFLIGVIALALAGSSFADVLTRGDLPRRMDLFMAVFAVTTFLTGMAYFTWFHGAVGQTPGKMLLRVRVVQVTEDRMTFGIAFLRWAGSLVSGLALCLGYLWIAFDRRKQGWHDKIAATLVIRVGKEPCIASPSPVRRDGEPASYTLTEDAPSDTGNRPDDQAGCTGTVLMTRLPSPQEPSPGDGAGAPASPPALAAAVSASGPTEDPPTACEGTTAPEKCLDKKGYIV